MIDKKYNMAIKIKNSQERIPEDFSDRIRRLRVKYELTQTRMAKIMGVSLATVNRWENGQSRPSRLAWQRALQDSLRKLARISVETAGEAATILWETLVLGQLSRQSQGGNSCRSSAER